MRNVADLAAVPFQIPEIAVAAPRDLVLKQAAGRAEAGAAWKENDLVFCTRLGGQLRVPPAVALGPTFESKPKTNGGQN